MKDLRQKLLTEGYAFEFFQAVRLLEDLEPGRVPCGAQGPYQDEAVGLRPNTSLGFPPGDIHKIERDVNPRTKRAYWRITQNIMGLYGTNSPLPSYFAEMIAQAYQDQDPLRDFLDIFNHRLLSLFYRAWKKHDLSQSGDLGHVSGMVGSLCAMIGKQPDTSDRDWKVAPQRLLRYAGLLSSGRRPAGGLEAMVSDYFGIEQVRVEQFLRRKVRLAKNDLSRIGDSGANNQLGGTLVLGEHVYDVGGQFKLCLGPMDVKSFLALQPGRPSYLELVFLVKLYTRQQLDFVLELILDSDQVEPLRLAGKESRHTLGRYSWLGTPQEKTVAARLTPDA